MPARKRTAQVEPEVTVNGASGEEVVPAYTLEPLSDEALSTVKVWGNFTQQTVIKLERTHPQWASMFRDIFTIVGQSVQEHGQ